MAVSRIKVELPYIAVAGEIKDENTVVTLKGVNYDEDEVKGGLKAYAMCLKFTAHGEVADRIRRMKLHSGSEVSVTAYMSRQFRVNSETGMLQGDSCGNPIFDFSFEIIAIDFVICRKRDKEEKKPEVEVTVPAAVTEKDVVADKQAFKKPAMNGQVKKHAYKKPANEQSVHAKAPSNAPWQASPAIKREKSAQHTKEQSAQTRKPNTESTCMDISELEAIFS